MIPWHFHYTPLRRRFLPEAIPHCAQVEIDSPLPFPPIDGTISTCREKGTSLCSIEPTFEPYPDLIPGNREPPLTLTTIARSVFR